jgi:hypothetical protein
MKLTEREMEEEAILMLEYWQDEQEEARHEEIYYDLMEEGAQ